MPKGVPYSGEFKEAVRAAYLELPRTSGTLGRKSGGAGKVKAGGIQRLMLRFGIADVKWLWKLVRDLQPWNKDRPKRG